VLVIPYDTPHKLLVHSSSFILKDANGKEISGLATIEFKASRSAPPPVFTFTVDRRKS
jgi:hypothetical protein